MKKHFKIGDIVMPRTNSCLTTDGGNRVFLAMTRQLAKDENIFSVTLDSFVDPKKHRGYQVTSDQLPFPEFRGVLSDWFMVKSLETGVSYIFKADDCVFRNNDNNNCKYYFVEDNSFAHEVGKPIKQNAQILCPEGEDIKNYPDDGHAMLIIGRPFKRKINIYDDVYKTYEFIKVQSLSNHKKYIVLYEEENISDFAE